MTVFVIESSIQSIFYFSFLSNFEQKSKTRFRHDFTGSGLSHTKNKTRFVLRRSGAFLKTYFYSILTYFDENPKWRPDDVIPEAVNINGSGSSAIPDIPRHFNTSDRNFEKIR